MAVETSLGAKAAALGHTATVVRDGKRFRLVCSCGVASQINWKRKTTFDWMSEHLTAVVRVAGLDPDGGDELHRAYPT